MRQILISIFCLLFYTNSALASVSTGLKRTFYQPDNSKITLTLRGDEKCHFYYTTDNIPVIIKDDGAICYVMVSNGRIVASDVMAHEADERRKAEIEFVNSNIGEVRKAISNITLSFSETNDAKRGTTSQGKSGVGTFGEYTGKKKGIVILVNFANLEMLSENTRETFEDMFNTVGYDKNGHIGSVHDYFYDQSYGKFDLTFDVVGPFTMKNNYGYYGKNSEAYGGDINVREMIVEACEQADEEVNFADYDWDGDGIVDQVYFIYAGYGEHAGAPANTIWPHESIIGKELILDGVKIHTYACSCELSGNSGKTMNGIGTACHEFSHCLGYPDLYDTDYSGAFGMSYWDLMNSGSHSGPRYTGERPYGYSAYERWCAGWLSPIEIDSTQHVEGLANLADIPTAYIIYNNGNRNEYYLLENHQSDRWYEYTHVWKAGHGLMITHVDYNEVAWKLNLVNPNPEHQRLTIIPADNRYDESESGFLGDLFPGNSNVTLLDNYSHENTGGRLYNLNTDDTYNMNVAICNIEENEKGEVSFDVFVGANALPIAIAATDNTQEGFTAHWTEADDAESYNISYTIVESIMPTKMRKETLTVGNVTSCEIKWPEKAVSCSYAVQAQVKGMLTPWSETESVKYPEPTGIENHRSHEDASITYSVNGVKVNASGKGIYIVRDKNGMTRKIVK